METRKIAYARTQDKRGIVIIENIQGVEFKSFGIENRRAIDGEVYLTWEELKNIAETYKDDILMK